MYSERYIRRKQAEEENRLTQKMKIEYLIDVYNEVNPIETFPKYNLPTLETAYRYSSLSDKLLLLSKVYNLAISDSEQNKIMILYNAMRCDTMDRFDSSFYMDGKQFEVLGNSIDFRGAK